MRPGLPSIFPQPPAWVLPQAKYDLDFRNMRYWGGTEAISSVLGNNGRIGSLVAGPQSGSTGLYAPDGNGLLVGFAAYVPRITLGKGLWAEQARTNVCLYCRDMTNAVWSKTNMTATRNQVGADGVANGATSLTATAANATCLQSITAAANSRVTSGYVRRLAGTGPISMTQDNAATWTPLTLTNGYAVVNVPSATVTNPVVGFKIETSGDSIAVDFVQCEIGTYPTTPILTTSAAATRLNEEPAFGDVAASSAAWGAHALLKDVFSGRGPWSFYGEYAGNPEVGSGWFMASDGPPNVAGGCNGGAFTFMGSTTSNNGTQGLANINKVAGRVTGIGSQACINGGSLSTLNTGAAGKPQPGASITHVGLGNNGAGNSSGPLNGYIARMTFWASEITDGQMIEFTR